MLIGTGISDYLDVLAAPGCEAAVISKLFAYLASQSDWSENTGETVGSFSLSPGEDRTARQAERGAADLLPGSTPPHPSPLLRFAEEREKISSLPRDEHFRIYDRWDVANFEELSPSSLLGSAILTDGFECEVESQSICPALRLPNTPDDLDRVVPARTLEKLRYYRRRAAKAGTFRVEQASSSNFDELFDAFLRLHAKRWNERGKSGVLAEERIQNFHREAARELLALDALRLFAFVLNDKIIGNLYCLRSATRYFYYLGGFDHAWSQLSPGNLLIGHAIEEAIREGATEFDFLRGQEKYKYDWGAEDRENRRMILQLKVRRRTPCMPQRSDNLGSLDTGTTARTE